jgi:hypothetical protein
MNKQDLYYYRKINNINENQTYKDTIISEMTQDYNNAREHVLYRFNVLINSIDAKDVYVNDSITLIKGVIDTSKKQTAETEMEQKIQVYPNKIKRGDYIKFKMNNTDDLRTYLIKSKIDKKNGYDEAIFEECNYNLKWMYNEKLFQMPCIVTNQTKYTLGIESKDITEGDSRYEIKMAYNEQTKNIKTGQRFIFDSNAWKVTQIDYVSNKGLLSILLGQTAINYEVDNLDLEIANYKIVNHTYTYNIPTSFEVSKDGEYQLVYSIKDETGKDIDYNLVNISTTNSDLIELTNTNGVINIKGLSAGIGNIKLVAELSSETKEFNISFEVKDVVVNQINYTTDFSQTTTIKQYVTSVLQVSKYNNGIKDDSLKMSYSFDSLGQSLISSNKIIVTRKSDSSIAIKNALVNATTTIYLTVTDDSDGTKILDNQAIVLVKGL